MVPSQEVSSFQPASLTDILPSIPKKGQTTIEVADYKRPEFEILFQEPTRSYFAGDVVCLKGQVKSFSGVKWPIPHQLYHISIITYSLSIHSFHIPWNNPQQYRRLFRNYFKAQDILATSAFRNSYLYEIKVKVTDTKGETEEMSTMLPIYSGKATPTLQLPEQVNKQQRTAFHISLAEIANDSNAYPVKIYHTETGISPTAANLSGHQRHYRRKTILEGHLSVFRKDSVFRI